MGGGKEWAQGLDLNSTCRYSVSIAKSDALTLRHSDAYELAWHMMASAVIRPGVPPTGARLFCTRERFGHRCIGPKTLRYISPKQDVMWHTMAQHWIQKPTLLHYCGNIYTSHCTEIAYGGAFRPIDELESLNFPAFDPYLSTADPYLS